MSGVTRSIIFESTSLERTGKLEEDVVFDHGKKSSAAFAVVGPCMVEVEGRTMIDEPESSVPYKHIRVAWRTVDVGHVRVEPEDRRGKSRVGLLSNRSNVTAPGR